MRFYITSFNIMQNYIISGQIQECPIKLKQTMAATKSLCEFYGGQFLRKMIHDSEQPDCTHLLVPPTQLVTHQVLTHFRYQIQQCQVMLFFI